MSRDPDDIISKLDNISEKATSVSDSVRAGIANESLENDKDLIFGLNLVSNNIAELVSETRILREQLFFTEKTRSFYNKLMVVLLSVVVALMIVSIFTLAVR